ncbi:MAG: efflux RND transporter periplasmic adaptor subunit [Acidimicrobiales bacterium]
MTRTHRLLIVNGLLVLVVAALVLFGVDTVFRNASARSAQRTVTVGTGTVESTVSATGNMSPAQTESLAFATGGTITEIDVSAGQSVSAGQVLAKLDPAAAQAALTAAQDNLSAAQDNLSAAQAGGETPPQQAQDNYMLSTASAAVSNAQANLNSSSQVAATDNANLQAALNAAQAKLSADQAACAQQQQQACADVGSDQSALTAASNNLSSVMAKDAQGVSAAQSALSQAQSALTSDQLSVAAKRYANPATIAQDNAQITSDQQTVVQDQKALAATTLTAPFAGTVTTVSATVGQTVGAGTSAATSSTGSGTGSSTAAGSTASSAGSSSTSSASGSSASGSSSTTVLTLADTSHLQVVAGFAEADASKIQVNQPATVSLSALPGVSVSGTVSALSSTSTVVSNVVTYAATIGLTNTPSTVKPGMTAQVQVVVDSRSGVLTLPSAAITTLGRTSTVVLLRSGKQTVQPVTTGLQGDTTTEITGGLAAGDVVVIPSASVSSSGATTRNTVTGGGIGGGLGGGGLGGGGLGGTGGRGG